MAPKTSDAFVDELKAMVAARNANLDHPFARKIMQGEVTRDGLRIWAAQRYKGITGMGAMSLIPLLAKAPDDAVRKHMWEVIGEEGGFTGAPSHSGWLLHFGKALGMTEEEFENARPLTETVAVRSFFMYKMAQGSFVEALSSMVPVESQNPPAFVHWAASLEKNYGIARKDLAWFIGHVEADSDDGGHGGEGWKVISRCASTDALRETVRNSVREALDIYWLSLDGIQRAAEQAGART